MPEQQFQVYECQNVTCRLRFPSNLSVQSISVCPLCGENMSPSGLPFSNFKLPTTLTTIYPQKVAILLDNLRSVLNVGSIFRSADGVGVAHIFCCGTTPTPAHSKFSKSGLGSEETIHWSYHRNALDVLSLPDNIESHIISLEVTQGSNSIFSPELMLPEIQSLLLIVGNEISGVDPELIRKSDNLLHIPMGGKKSSLNVAVAAAIAMYSLRFIRSEKS
jgi:23S rRNA (guanosine2251-2'-O)-methyltransferase